jgi:GTPase
VGLTDLTIALYLGLYGSRTSPKPPYNSPLPPRSNPIDTLYGKLTGLKPSQLKQMQRLYHQRIPGACLTTVEFGQRLAALSTEIKQPLSVYLNRRGQVIRVGVGTPRQTQIPLGELPRYGADRLCGIRCITTDLQANSPSKATLTAMVLQRLDALVSVGLSGQGFTRRGGGAVGYVQGVYWANLLPQGDPPWAVAGPMTLEALADQDFPAWVEGLEEEFQREGGARQVDSTQERVVVVGLQTQDRSPLAFEQGLAEVQRLVESAGGAVLEVVRQRRPRPHPQTVVGDGKVEEIALIVQNLGANLVVFDRDLSPAQGRNLERRMGVRVVDRTQVILDIFAQRARSGAGKLQVELAQLEYCLPRLVGQGQAMSRLGGGIGTRGPGETQLETERRTIQQRIARLQQEVAQLQAHRARLRRQRQHRQIPSIALIGYTNAGKSTLLHVLTSAQVYTADQLFATLDPTTRRLVIHPDPPLAPPMDPQEDSQLVPQGGFQVDPLMHRPEDFVALGDRPHQTLLLTDTVGFIHELPPSLVDAFRATLEEVTEADALLHLVDLSHPAWDAQIRSVNAILDKIAGELAMPPGPVLLVFNKMDCVSSEALAIAQEKFPQAIFISASEGLGLHTLRQRLSQLVYYATLP